MKNKIIAFIVTALLLSFVGIAGAGKVMTNPVWRSANKDFCIINDHAIVCFNVKAEVPADKAKIMEGMKIIETDRIMVTDHVKMPPKLDELLSFRLSDGSLEVLVYFDYISNGADREGKNGPIGAIHYDLLEFKSLVPVSSIRDNSLKDVL